MMKNLWIMISVLLLLFLGGCRTKELTAQQLEKMNLLKGAIEKPDFVFEPNSAQPMSGRLISLSGTYSLKVVKDTVEAYLPYYGRAYVAPINPSEGGIKFVSTDFTYESSIRKKGNYKIKITPKDVSMPDYQGLVLLLDVSTSGYGSLQVLLNNKQPISFSGTIQRK